jgi:AraC-like DNA-binding protein
MAAIALWLLDAFLRVSGVYGQNPNWYFSPIYYSFAFGPLLYFYVRSLTNSSFRFRPVHYLHFVPVLCQGVLYGVLHFLPYAGKQWFWLHVHQPITYRIEFNGTWVSLTVYLIMSLGLLRQYARWLPDNFSNLAQLRLRWLQILLVGIGLVCVQWLAEVVLREVYNRYYEHDFSTEMLGLLVFFIGVAGLRQANMAQVQFEADAVAIAPLLDPAENKSPAVQALVDETLLAKISHALETEGLYRNPTLSLNELAAYVAQPPKLVSQTLNRGFGKPFSDVVNNLRVQEVKRRLANPQDVARLTLLGIALEAGFNSKTTFNRIFKEMTGVAPRDYKPQ